MVAEIDPRAGRSDRDDIVEYGLERLGGHQIGNKTGHAALCGGRGLAVRIERDARPRNILAVAEMEMDVDRSWKNHQSRSIDFVRSRSRLARRQNRSDVTVSDRDVTSGPAAFGQDGIAASYDEVESVHAGYPRFRRQP